MREPIDRLQAALLNAAVFVELPKGEHSAIAALVREQKLAAQETMVVRGQPLAGLVLVLEGALELMIDSSPICALSPGSLFCEDALVAEMLAPATVRAQNRARIGILERAKLLPELARLPQLRRALEQAWRRRVLAAGLYRIDLFQALSAEARLLLLDRFERVELPPGTVLATEGEPGEAFTFIRDGEAQLHLGELMEGAGDPPKLLAGDYLNDSVLVDDGPQTATVTTASGLTAMQLSRLQFEDALSALPGQLEEARATFRRRSEGMF